MAIHATCVNGFGSVTITGSTATTTGMKVEDHMHFSQDYLNQAGVVETTDMTVSQNGSPNMSVNVGAGSIYVLNPAYTAGSVTQNKFWRFVNSAASNVVISANGSGNPRITSIFAKLNVAATPDDDASNVASFVAVDGTPAASPSAPSAPDASNGYVRLANITVASGATSITTANITDTRTLARLDITKSTWAPPQGMGSDYQLVPSISSNQLVLALKNIDGSDPSVERPLYFRIGNAMRKVTSTLSITVPNGVSYFASGSTLLATLTLQYFAYIGYRAASDTVFLGIARLPYFNTYADASGTTTNQAYLYYSGSAPASTDSLHVIGRFNAILSGTASFNWSLPASTKVINAPIFETDTNQPWTPSYSASGSMTFTSVSTGFAYYKVRNDILEFDLFGTGTTGGTANNTLIATLPFSGVVAANSQVVNANVVDTSLFAGGLGYISTSTPSQVEARKSDSSNFGLGASRQMAVSGRVRLR